MLTFFYSITRKPKAHNSTLKIYQILDGLYGPLPYCVVDNVRLMYRSDERAILEELANSGEAPDFVRNAISLQTLRNQGVVNIVELG